MGGRTFECLDAVINRYRKEQIVEGHTLALPVCRVSKLKTEWKGIDSSRVNVLIGIVQSTAETDTPIKPKEVQQAEKIYTTLRECREQVGLKKVKGEFQ